jgi:hypothetical protein
MTLWIPLGIILLCGAVGGIINAIISDNGFVKPREEIDNVCIVRPGIAGNILLGTTAAFISWGLYGSYSGVLNFWRRGSNGLRGAESLLSAVAAAILVGMGGARWLTNEVDKSFLKTATVTAAASRPSFEDSQRMVVSTTAQAFNIAKGMYLNG